MSYVLHFLFKLLFEVSGVQGQIKAHIVLLKGTPNPPPRRVVVMPL